MKNWKSQIVISNQEKMGMRKLRLVFTELGVAMHSSVSYSERAIDVNIQVIRIFSRIRELLITNNEVPQELIELETLGIDHDKKISRLIT